MANSGVVGTDGYAWTALHQFAYQSLIGNVLQNSRQGLTNIQINAAGYALFLGGGTLVNGGNTTLTGTPNGLMAAPVGAFTCRGDGGPNYTCYVKESGGATATGWDAIATNSVTNNQAALGTTQATAQPLIAPNTIITVVTAGTATGVILRGATQQDQTVVNASTSGLPLTLYPMFGAQLNFDGTNTGLSVPYKDLAKCSFAGSTQYYCTLATLP